MIVPRLGYDVRRSGRATGDDATRGVTPGPAGTEQGLGDEAEPLPARADRDHPGDGSLVEKAENTSAFSTSPGAATPVTSA